MTMLQSTASMNQANLIWVKKAHVHSEQSSLSPKFAKSISSLKFENISRLYTTLHKITVNIL